MTNKLALIAATLVLMAAPAKAQVVIITDPGSFAALGTINKLSVPGNAPDQNNYVLGDAVFSANPLHFLAFYGANQFGATRDYLVNGVNSPIDVAISGNYQLVSFLFGRFNPGTFNQPISVTTNLGNYSFVMPMGSILAGGEFTFAGFATTGAERITRVSFSNDTPEGFNTNTAIAEVGFGNYAAIGVVPEPTVWAMMILGFGLIGGTLRTRKARSASLAG